ncbi:MAG: hypothetical protein ACI87E_004549 [Mariniblastus sp.]|jgi:hypothetical protein
MQNHSIKPFMILFSLVIALPVSAQDPVGYKFEPRIVTETAPVTLTKWVDETVNEKKTITTYKHVTQTETRYRTTTEYRPVQETSEREERTVVQKPIQETKFRRQETTSTTYDTVTEMRDEKYTVRKPVIETQMRSEQYTVRKPITEQLIEVQKTTTFKPVTNQNGSYTPGSAVIALRAVADPNQRQRLQMLAPGNYTDPATGQTVYRRRGLHWVQPSMTVAETAPTLFPNNANSVTYVPETTEVRKPVEITRYVDQTETRQVPVQVQKTIEQVETRKVPVTIRIPRTKTVVEDVPYTETTYRDVVTVTKVPVTTTTYEKFQTKEPYEVEVSRWIPVTEEVDVPRTVRRKVDYTEQRKVSRTVMYKIPVDALGNPVGKATAVRIEEAATPPTLESEFSEGYGTTRGKPRTENFSPLDSTSRGNEKSILERNNAEETEIPDEDNQSSYRGTLQWAQPITTRKPTIDVPDTRTTADSMGLSRIVGQGDDAPLKGAAPATPKATDANTKPDVIKDAKMPEDVPSETGNENAGGPPVN